ncbi:MAG: carbohydrate ABC transporter permease [Spirochaetales bacterium]|nr:carbohydrate ABC transporter permease [Spirochaetales bacterium]
MSTHVGTRGKLLMAKLPIWLVLLVLVVVWTVPTLGLLVSSLRTPEAITTSGWWTVFGNFFDGSQWTFENYMQVIFADNMGNAFFNSLLVTIPSTVIPITIAAFAAFAIAWLEFPGREAIFIIIVGLLVVPLQMALIPILRLYTRADLNGTFLGIWLAHTGFGLPLAVYLLYGYIVSIPKEIIESAHADGATPWTTFTKLIIPLSVPAIASFAIFQFLWVWNDLLVALVFLGTKASNAIVTTRLAEIVGSRGQDWHVLTSGAFLTMIVPLIMFFSLQKYFVRGMMAGSVKG